ncbi:hypothetical protein [Acidocella sp.]|uniref:hypothetical protein n=1 Tax=Acidocella sp. TaxID=50710 RepID=UPI0026283AF8|nr:hypothetical protein [Acidocella sp.]
MPVFPFRQVDVFAARPGKGNPVAVVHGTAAQGTCLGREGRIHVEHEAGAFWIGGDCITLVEGTLTL